MAALEAIVLSFVPSDERTLRLLLTSLCLVAALLVAALVVALVNRWRRQRDAQEDASPNVQLAHFRSLYDAGAISAEEFERLRAVLAAQLRQSMGTPPRAGSVSDGTTGETPVPPARTGETPVPPARTGETPVPPDRTGETPVPPARTGETPVPPEGQTGETPVPPKEPPDGPDTGIRPA